MIKKNNIFIVAEAGNNHEGNFNTAKKLIDKASESGADAIKFQTYDVDNFIDPKFKKSYEKFKKFSLSYEEFYKLSQHCKKKNIIFFSTPFDLKSAIFLNKIQKIFKISSGDNNFTDLISLVASFNKDLIISSGLLKLKDLKNIYKLIKKIRGKNLKLSFLHCVSSYPTPLDYINLANIKMIKENFSDVNVGLSDHTIGIKAPIYAALVGAKIIEKHFTLDNKFSNFRDHALSLNPKDFRKMVDQIREAERILGNNKKLVLPFEKKNLTSMRRSAYSSRILKKGQILGKKDIIYLRPGGGIDEKEVKKILGKKIKVKIGKVKLIQKNFFNT
jgi:N,N'-diacetyllegionaminate synthase